MIRNQKPQPLHNVAAGIKPPARYNYYTSIRVSSHQGSNKEGGSQDGESMARIPVTGPAADLTILGYNKGTGHAVTDAFHEGKPMDHAWDSYRASFTMVMSKGYIKAVEELRGKMLRVEWEENQRQVALQMSIAKFEEHCYQSQVQISTDVLKQLYEEPENFHLIEDASLRMRLRSIVKQTEAIHYLRCYKDCTDDARRLAQQFSEGEFISQMLPNPVEHGLLKSIEMLVESFRTVK